METFLENYWWIFVIIVLVEEYIRKSNLIKKNEKRLKEELDEIKNFSFFHPEEFYLPSKKNTCFQVIALNEDKILLEELGTSFKESSPLNRTRWYFSKNLSTEVLSVGKTFKVIEVLSSDRFAFQAGPSRKDW